MLIRDTEGKPVSLLAKTPFTQYDIDSKCRVITSDNGILTKTFGSGIAFPMRTNDGMMMPDPGKLNPRADSFSLYQNFVAKTMLQNLLPKSKNENKLHKINRNQNNGRPTGQQAQAITSGQMEKAQSRTPVKATMPVKQALTANGPSQTEVK